MHCTHAVYSRIVVCCESTGCVNARNSRLYIQLVTIDVNLAGIPGERMGLLRWGEEWGVGRSFPSPPVEGLGGDRPLPRTSFKLEMVCLGNSEQYLFVRVVARNMLNFPHKVVIWWSLKMRFWKIVNTLSGLWDW